MGERAEAELRAAGQVPPGYGLSETLEMLSDGERAELESLRAMYTPGGHTQNPRLELALLRLVHKGFERRENAKCKTCADYRVLSDKSRCPDCNYDSVRIHGKKFRDIDGQELLPLGYRHGKRVGTLLSPEFKKSIGFVEPADAGGTPELFRRSHLIWGTSGEMKNAWLGAIYNYQLKKHRFTDRLLWIHEGTLRASLKERGESARGQMVDSIRKSRAILWEEFARPGEWYKQEASGPQAQEIGDLFSEICVAIHERVFIHGAALLFANSNYDFRKTFGRAEMVRRYLEIFGERIYQV